MANIASDDEDTEVQPSKPQLSYDELLNAYDKILNDSKVVYTQYASLNKNLKNFPQNSNFSSFRKRS